MIKKELVVYVTMFNAIFGSYAKLREIHFNTLKQAQHDLTNKIMPELMDYADTIMENAMGIHGRPGMNIIECPKSPKSTIKEILEELKIKVLDFESVINKQEKEKAASLKIADDLLADLNKWIYLSVNE